MCPTFVARDSVQGYDIFLPFFFLDYPNPLEIKDQSSIQRHRSTLLERKVFPRYFNTTSKHITYTSFTL